MGIVAWLSSHGNKWHFYVLYLAAPAGAAGGSFTGGVLIASDPRAEVKARANGEGFATIERWLGTNDVLFVLGDRAVTLEVLPRATYQRLIRRALLVPDQCPMPGAGAPSLASCNPVNWPCDKADRSVAGRWRDDCVALAQRSEPSKIARHSPQ